MIIDRINHLLDRATHPETPEEEARSAALIAVRLIREGSYKIVSPVTEEQAADPNVVVIEDMGVEVAVRKEQSVRPTAYEARRAAKESRPTYRVKRAQWDGHCRACGGAIRRGEDIAYGGPQAGSTHTTLKCLEHWSKR